MYIWRTYILQYIDLVARTVQTEMNYQYYDLRFQVNKHENVNNSECLLYMFRRIRQELQFSTTINDIQSDSR